VKKEQFLSCALNAVTLCLECSKVSAWNVKEYILALLGSYR